MRFKYFVTYTKIWSPLYEIINEKDFEKLNSGFAFTYVNGKLSILNKGFKYLIDYYSNSIENLISIYESSIHSNYFLPSVYISRYNEFYIPTYLIYNELRLIFNKITFDLEEAFFKISDLFFIVILVISGGFLILELFVILIKWRKYINKIKLEEYMSNKIIAEIPMHIIRQNNEIWEHLLMYSNNNS